MVMIWQLLQARHVEKTVPLILVGRMSTGLITWAKSAMLSTKPPLANPGDMTIPVCVSNADEANLMSRRAGADEHPRVISSGASENEPALSCFETRNQPDGLACED
jgi:hypothetical protein